nr:zinc finger, CCHC-type [Tanacetum cinerariifolium]
MHTFIRDAQTTKHDFVFYVDRLIRSVIEHGLGHLPFTIKAGGNSNWYVVLTSRVVVPTGRYVVPTGRVVVPTGRYVVPTGRVVVPTGRYVVPTGRVVVPTGRYVVSTGRVVVPTGRYVVPTGRVMVPTGSYELQAKHVERILYGIEGINEGNDIVIVIALTKLISYVIATFMSISVVLPQALMYWKNGQWLWYTGIADEVLGASPLLKCHYEEPSESTKIVVAYFSSPTSETSKNFDPSIKHKSKKIKNHLNFDYKKQASMVEGDKNDNTSNSTSVRELGNVSLQYPKLTETNYTTWALMMETILKAYGISKTIVAKDGVATNEKKENTSKAIIFQTLPQDILMKVAQYSTAKEVWDSIKVKNLGADLVQKARLQTLRSELETLRIKPNKKVSDFGGKLSSIMAKFKGLGETLEDKVLARKLLNSAPKKFLPIVATIEQYQDLDEMLFEEAIGRLTAYEERIKSQDTLEANDQDKLLMASSNNKTYRKWRGKDFNKEGKESMR